MQVRSEDRAAPGEATDFSFSAGVLLAAVIVLGPVGGALIVAPALALVDELRGTPRRAIAFNAGCAAISAFVAGSLYRLAGGTTGAVVLPREVPQLLLVAGLAYAINLLLVDGLVSAISGRRLRDLATATARGQVLSATSEAGFGVALAYFLVEAPWAALTLAPLVIGVYKAHARVELQRRETERALETFANVVDERDHFTAHHSLRVAETVHAFAEWLGRSPQEAARLRWAGRLHDLGKITVDSAVLHKPSALDDDEWAAMRAHPRLSARLLRRFSLTGEEARAVELHHERFDGRGYYGVEPERIPLAAHFLTVADSFDAMTNDRPYRNGFTPEDALAEIERGIGTQFHPTVARAFVGFKRGLAAEEALAAGELAALGGLWRAEADTRRRQLRRPSAATAAVVLVLASLAAIAAGSLAAAALAAAGAVALSLHVVAGHERARRLSVRLRRALAHGNLDDAVAALAATTNVQFAAVVPRAAEELVTLLGRVADPTALRSWLAAAEADTVTDEGAAIGASGFVLALPLGQPDVRAHLVMQFAAEPPRRVADALTESLDDFRSLSYEPERTQLATQLTAIA
jgi:putative nucleotidyltransferase with HDIG domain